MAGSVKQKSVLKIVATEARCTLIRLCVCVCVYEFFIHLLKGFVVRFTGLINVYFFRVIEKKNTTTSMLQCNINEQRNEGEQPKNCMTNTQHSQEHVLVAKSMQQIAKQKE